MKLTYIPVKIDLSTTDINTYSNINIIFNLQTVKKDLYSQVHTCCFAVHPYWLLNTEVLEYFLPLPLASGPPGVVGTLFHYSYSDWPVSCHTLHILNIAVKTA